VLAPCRNSRLHRISDKGFNEPIKGRLKQTQTLKIMIAQARMLHTCVAPTLRVELSACCCCCYSSAPSTLVADASPVAACCVDLHCLPMVEISSAVQDNSVRQGFRASLRLLLSLVCRWAVCANGRRGKCVRKLKRQARTRSSSRAHHILGQARSPRWQEVTSIV